MDTIKRLDFPSGAMLQFLEDDELGIHRYEYWGADATTGPDELFDGTHAAMESARICKPPDEWVFKWLARGRRVHKATEFYDLDQPVSKLWMDSTEGVYLEGWKKFRAAHPEFCSPQGVEELKASEDAGVATVVDRWYQDARILQIKTGSPNAKVHAVQLAIEGLLTFPSASEFTRWCVYLDDAGGFTLKKYEDEESLGVAMDIMRSRRSARKYMTTRRKPTKAVKVT